MRATLNGAAASQIFEELWGLRHSDGWVTMGDDAGQMCTPIWPHKRYAECFIRGGWSDATATMIELEAWMTRWLPGMASDGLHVAVFPVQGEKQQGVIIPPEDLQRDLEAELKQYEDDDNAA